MSLTRVTLAVEDVLSDAVATKILESCGFEIAARLKQQGNTYLKQKAPELNRAAARNRPVFLLTDLDSPKNCPLDLIQSWIKGSPKPGFFFRVAVMEVESWVLADRGPSRVFSRFLPVKFRNRQTRLPIQRNVLFRLRVRVGAEQYAKR